MMLKRLKYIQPVIGILFILVILIVGKQAHSGYYSCNDLTSSSFDLNLFNEDSTVNLFRDNRLAKRANRLCLKQLKKDQTNPQFNFQVAYTYLALREFDEAKDDLEEGDDWIPYEDLTEADIIGWVEDDLDDQLDSMKLKLDAQIAKECKPRCEGFYHCPSKILGGRNSPRFPEPSHPH